MRKTITLCCFIEEIEEFFEIGLSTTVFVGTPDPPGCYSAFLREADIISAFFSKTG